MRMVRLFRWANKMNDDSYYLEIISKYDSVLHGNLYKFYELKPNDILIDSRYLFVFNRLKYYCNDCIHIHDFKHNQIICNLIKAVHIACYHCFRYINVDTVEDFSIASDLLHYIDYLMLTDTKQIKSQLAKSANESIAKPIPLLVLPDEFYKIIADGANLLPTNTTWKKFINFLREHKCFNEDMRKFADKPSAEFEKQIWHIFKTLQKSKK